jgi:methyl-accepting chemotaxis protein
MKIQIKLTLTITVLLFFAVLTTGTFIYFKTNSIQIMQTETSALSIVNQERDIISEVIAKEQIRPSIFTMNENILKELSRDNTPKDVKNINELLEDYAKENSMLDGIFIADANAIIIANSDSSMLGADLSDRDYAKATLSAGKTQISETLISKKTGEPIVVFTQPIINPDNNELIGFVATPIKAQGLVNHMVDLNINNAKTSMGFVVDKQGNYVWMADAEKIGKPNEIQEISDVIATLNKGETIGSSMVQFNHEGKKMIGAYSVINDTSWVVVGATEEKEILAPLMQMWALVGIAELIIVIIASLIGFIFSRKISKPIVCITENLDQLATGDLEVNIPKEYLNSKDEIGKLSVAMNNIVSSLQEKSYVAEQIAKGELSLDIKSRSDKDVLSKSMLSVSNSIKGLVSEMKMITAASIEGDLDVRGNSEKFDGEYKEIIDGINRTIEAVIQPVKEAADVLGEMSEGNLNVKVRGEYKGHHAMIKNSLNDTIDALSGYVDEITRVLTQMTEGNFEVLTSDNYKGEFSKIKASLDNIINTFNEVLGEINVAAQQVANGAKHISNSAQVLSQGATEQASTVEELTTSMEQIADQTKYNAESAEKANTVAAKVKEDAVKGNSQMGEMLKAMNDINNASGSISKIIKVIDDIAFQTNILALNAAVEAARAGQHGKGFAVVADEVRNLAAKSADAAKETTALIESSIMKTEDGLMIAKGTADALNNIVSGIAEASELVNKITTATSEQANGIVQINLAVNQVSQVVQNNSATAEESAAASEEMASQAEVLNNLVGQFRLRSKNAYEKYAKNSYDIEPEILKQVENTIKKEKSTKYKGKSKQSRSSNKNPINLSESDYGKY